MSMFTIHVPNVIMKFFDKACAELFAGNDSEGNKIKMYCSIQCCVGLHACLLSLPIVSTASGMRHVSFPFKIALFCAPS